MGTRYAYRILAGILVVNERLVSQKRKCTNSIKLGLMRMGCEHVQSWVTEVR
jgi:hypothetical protein